MIASKSCSCCEQVLERELDWFEMEHKAASKVGDTERMQECDEALAAARQRHAEKCSKPPDARETIAEFEFVEGAGMGVVFLGAAVRLQRGDLVRVSRRKLEGR